MAYVNTARMTDRSFMCPAKPHWFPSPLLLEVCWCDIWGQIRAQVRGSEPTANLEGANTGENPITVEETEYEYSRENHL